MKRSSSGRTFGAQLLADPSAPRRWLRRLSLTGDGTLISCTLPDGPTTLSAPAALRGAGAQLKLSLLSGGQVGRIGNHDQNVSVSTHSCGHLVPCSATTRPKYPRYRPCAQSTTAFIRAIGSAKQSRAFFRCRLESDNASTDPGKLALVREALMIRGLHARICPRTTCDRCWHKFEVPTGSEIVRLSG